MQELFYFGVSVFAVGMLIGFVVGNIFSRETPAIKTSTPGLNIERIQLGRHRENNS